MSTALEAARGNGFVEAARAVYPDASPKLKTALGDVLGARGLIV